MRLGQVDRPQRRSSVDERQPRPDVVRQRVGDAARLGSGRGRSRPTRRAPTWRAGPSRSAGRSARCARCGRRSGRRSGSSSAARCGTGRREPNRATLSPSTSWRSRHGWLKNTTCRRPVPSPTTASTIVRRLRVVRRWAERTVTRTSASVPARGRRRALRWCGRPTAADSVISRSRTDSMPNAFERVALALADAAQLADVVAVELAQRDPGCLTPPRRGTDRAVGRRRGPRARPRESARRSTLDSSAVTSASASTAGDQRDQLPRIDPRGARAAPWWRRRRRRRWRRCRHRARCPASRPQRRRRPASSRTARPGSPRR